MAQREAIAKLEVKGAKCMEDEINKLRHKLNQKGVEMRTLQQELDGAKKKLREDERTGTAISVAACTAW